MVYAIRAMENTYKGSNGIVSYSIVVSDFYEEVENLANEMCDRLIDENNLTIPWEDEWNMNDYEDACDAQRIYDIWEIPNTRGKSLDKLHDIFEETPTLFINEYCVSI